MRKLLFFLLVFTLLVGVASARTTFKLKASDGTINWVEPIAPKPGPLPSEFVPIYSRFTAYVSENNEQVSENNKQYSGYARLYSGGYVIENVMILRRGEGVIIKEIKHPVSIVIVSRNIKGCFEFSSTRVYCDFTGRMIVRGFNINFRSDVETFRFDASGGLVNIAGGHSWDDLFRITGMTYT